MDVAAGHAECGVVGEDGLFVWPVQEAVDLAVGVVVQLDLAYAELVRKHGPERADLIGRFACLSVRSAYMCAFRSSPAGG